MKRGIDYIGVGVGALILNDAGQVFLTQRGPQAKNERGLWECPGGSVEFGETLAAALQREMREEFGIDIEVGDLVDVFDHILPEEQQHWVSPTFICTIKSGAPQILEPEKCSAIGWFSLAERSPTEHRSAHDLPENLTMITRHNLASYRSLDRLPPPAGGNSCI